MFDKWVALLYAQLVALIGVLLAVSLLTDHVNIRQTTKP